MSGFESVIFILYQLIEEVLQGEAANHRRDDLGISNAI